MNLRSAYSALEQKIGLCPASSLNRAHSSHSSRPKRRISERMQPCLAASAPQAQEATEQQGVGKVKEESKEYTDVMQKRMGGSLTYRHEDGMNFAYVMDDLIVGSCPQKPADIDRLAQEGVRTIFCLQQDSDMAYFQLDVKPLQQRCAERGDIKHVRFPIRDFDPFDLRMRLPAAVQLLAKEHAANGGTMYIHCTAGLGRAPGVALAYMYWMRDLTLPRAYDMLWAVRPCHPKLASIRAATCSILFDSDLQRVVIAVDRKYTMKRVQVAGLDVGWGEQLDMGYDTATQRFVLERRLPPGRFAYKFIFDGRWSYSADHPTLNDGGNINNYVEVPGSSDPAIMAARKRLMSEDGTLTPEEREHVVAAILGAQTF